MRPARLLLLGLVTAAWSLASRALGAAGILLPSLGLACVLLVARRSPGARYQATAAAAGLGTGLLLGGAWLVPPIVLLILGALAHAARLAVRLRFRSGVAALGMVFACLEILLLRAFAGDAFPPVLEMRWLGYAAAGAMLSGILYAALDAFVDARPRFRHSLERP